MDDINDARDRINELRDELDATRERMLSLEATVSIAVDRSRASSRLTLFQRIDDLRAIEAERDAMSQRVKALEHFHEEAARQIAQWDAQNRELVAERDALRETLQQLRDVADAHEAVCEFSRDLIVAIIEADKLLAPASEPTP